MVFDAVCFAIINAPSASRFDPRNTISKVYPAAYPSTEYSGAYFTKTVPRRFVGHCLIDEIIACKGSPGK